MNCPGSYHAEQDLPDLQDDGAAGSGTLIHTIAAGLIDGIQQGGSVTDRELFIACWLAEEWKKLNCGIGIGEQEITITDSNGITKWTGHPDRYAMSPEKDRIILHEWKSGRNTVETAAGNAQLRLYAVALWQMYGRPVEAHLLAYGNEEGERHTVINLSMLDIEESYQDAIKIWKRCQKKNAKRFTGDHCKYCKAEGLPRCPESCKALTVAEPTLPCDPAQLALLFDAAQNAERIAKKVKDYAKAFVKGGGNLPGYQLSKPSSRNVVKDIKAAWLAMSEVMSEAEFFPAMKLSVPDLIKVYREISKGTEKEAKEVVLKMLGSLVTEQKIEGHLEKVKDE